MGHQLSRTVNGSDGDGASADVVDYCGDVAESHALRAPEVRFDRDGRAVLRAVDHGDAGPAPLRPPVISLRVHGNRLAESAPICAASAINARLPVTIASTILAVMKVNVSTSAA